MPLLIAGGVMLVLFRGYAQDIGTAAGKAAKHRTFGIECATCHSTASWKDIKPDIAFDHKLTGYALHGRHASVRCEGCHGKVRFADLKTACASCHADRHKGEFGDRCQDCHTPSGWRSPSEQVAKHQLTRFPLLGAHEKTACESCHVNQQESEYVQTSTECFSCHRDEYLSAKEPDHAGNNFDRNCIRCHEMSALSWHASFTHPFIPFQATPAHASLACAQCHRRGYVNTPTDCFGCHESDFTGTKSPDHVAGNFDHNCTLCHEAVKWRPATFDHDRSRFPLRGRHASTPCAECHAGGYSAIQTDCWSCHEKDYAAAAFPNHAQGQFDHACDRCHSLDAWKPAQFNHDNTNFRLTGAHQRTECQRCHIGGVYTGLPLACEGCHRNDYQQTTRPNHQLVGFTMQCADCHNTTAWQPVDQYPTSIDHDKTRFPLLGAHKNVLCEKCHVNRVFAGTTDVCYECHRTDYASSRNPEHTAGQFSHDCTTCHGMNGWKPATFDHASTKFPLTGRHQTAACEACHVGGNYQLAYTDCYQCHQSDFAQAKDPDHAAAQISHDCATCHGTAAWKPSTFDHSTTRFPLENAHRAALCADCHRNGQFSGLATDCWTCHETDYLQSTLPSHSAGQFPHECATCHDTRAWKPSTFDHGATRFALEGAHMAVACQDCHANGRYSNLQTDCWSCHQRDFDAVVAPNHAQGQFPHDCLACHTTARWKPASFDHAATRFPLQGAHARADCQQCHAGGKYTGTATDCWSCHQTDYQGVATPNHANGQFNHDCAYCHGLDAWKPTQLDHNKTRFPLTGRHVATACELCHVNGQYGVTLPTDCYGCHDKDFTTSQSPGHVAAQFPHDCTVCHSTAGWKPSTFDHAATPFPLTGAHVSTPCQDCHTGGNYTLRYIDCWQCHEQDFRGTVAPNHTSAQFAHDCTTCHNANAWKPAAFNHATTKFPLEGAHAAQACEKCHVNGNYQLQYIDCWQCHQSDFTAAANPNHVAAQFAHDCLDCHNAVAWKPSTFDHTRTKFPLTGAHAAQPCQQCHVNGNYALTYTDCYQCHQADFASAQTPNHVAAQFAHDCASCHSVTAWKPSTFDHQTTKFKLEGAHSAQPCQACHINGNYSLAYVDCWQCHQNDFTRAAQPSHAQGAFPHDCLTCHTTAAWKPSTFSHAATAFPLEGSHATQPCEKCHTNGNYGLQYTDCYQCHQAQYNGVTNPNHAAGNFSHNCAICHTSAAWKPSQVDHDRTAFPLTGKHKTAQCYACHVGGNYNLTYTDCKQCHATEFASAKNPDHAAGQFPAACQNCHGTVSWKPSTFNHAATRFPLLGAHIPVACQQCHVNGNYSLQYTDCFQCHAADFNGAMSPPHAAGQFPHDCMQCHAMNAWKPSTFNHASTNFPLTGAHIAATCQSCHVNGNYSLTYTDCWQCHQSDYSAAQNPNHVSGQFPHDCTMCHNTTSYRPSTFTHASTRFPLVGGHVPLACAQCHVNGNYTLTYTDCWQCHEGTYNGTTNPNHLAWGMPHDCLTCHTQTGWTPATFNHDQTAFPLQGAHVGKPCNACHVGGNYQLQYADCYQCHQGDYTSAQSPNHVTNQFPHTCVTCHTQTVWTPSTFNHASTNFPLTGAHTAQPCVACHTNGNYSLTYTDCWQCHQADYTGATNPNHASNQFSHDCATCHTTAAWSPSTFNHAGTGFPLQGAHTSVACVLCHVNGNYNIHYTDCYQCHQSDFTGATTPANHSAMNLSHDCTVCHTQSAWTPATPFRTSHNVNAPQGFPIYGSAKHRYPDRWSTCNECHTTNSTAAFCCTGCHNNQSELNNDHSGVNGYSYNCTSCANTGCHPDGREP